MLSPVAKAHMITRPGSPPVEEIPAAFEAMMIANGLMVEAIVPTQVPTKMTATGTIISYPAARKTGTSNG